MLRSARRPMFPRWAAVVGLASVAVVRATVNRFARLFVMPQAGHGLSGTSDTTDGNGKAFPPRQFRTGTTNGVCFSTVWKRARRTLGVTAATRGREFVRCAR